jgi:hypothetical protein
MGRTIHYSISKKTNFTEKEHKIMLDVSSRYNSDELLKDINRVYGKTLKELWTCESFHLGLDYYPNWDKLKRLGYATTTEGWEYVESHIKEDENEVKSILDAEKKGIITFFKDDFKKELRGFTKTQGNEFNSLLVYKALIEISKKIPKATIEVSDEGEFLLCPLKIKNGLVLPQIEDLLDSIRHYSMSMLFSKGFEGNILDKLQNTDFQTEFFKNDVGVENTYGNMANYIDAKLRNLKEIEKQLVHILGDNHNLYFYNLENRKEKDWFAPELFVRNVNIEKFLDYEMTGDTLMDGFDGEGFELADEDSAKKSREMINNLFSMLEKTGFKKDNIKKLGEDY